MAKTLTKKESREVVQDIIATCSDKVLSELALKIWAYQTADEQASNETLESNGVGYNKGDAYPVGKFLRTYLRDGIEALTASDFDDMRKRLRKYALQLSGILTDLRALKEQGKPVPPRPSLEVVLYVDTIVRETARAILVLFREIGRDGPGFRKWFPKKLVVAKQEENKVALYIPNWLALKEELVDADMNPLVAPVDPASYIPKAKPVPERSAEKQMKLKFMRERISKMEGGAE